MREIRQSGSEGGGAGEVPLSLPLSLILESLDARSSARGRRA